MQSSAVLRGAWQQAAAAGCRLQGCMAAGCSWLKGSPVWCLLWAPSLGFPLLLSRGAMPLLLHILGHLDE